MWVNLTIWSYLSRSFHHVKSLNLVKSVISNQLPVTNLTNLSKYAIHICLSPSIYSRPMTHVELELPHLKVQYWDNISKHNAPRISCTAGEEKTQQTKHTRAKTYNVACDLIYDITFVEISWWWYYAEFTWWRWVSMFVAACMSKVCASLICALHGYRQKALACWNLIFSYVAFFSFDDLFNIYVSNHILETSFKLFRSIYPKSYRRHICALWRSICFESPDLFSFPAP